MKMTKLSSKSGQSLVEMALLLPVLLLLAVVTLDLGRGIYYYTEVYNAAREGARYGIIHPDDATGITNAATRLAVGLDQSQLTVITCECGKTCINVNSCPANYKNIIRVKVTYNFKLVTPLANLFTSGGQIPMKSTSMMAIER
jgi:Flp pilus assembly protein TadG